MIYNKNNILEQNIIQIKNYGNRQKKVSENSIITKTFNFYSNTEGIDIIFRFKSDTFHREPTKSSLRPKYSKQRKIFAVLNIQLKSYFPS